MIESTTSMLNTAIADAHAAALDSRPGRLKRVVAYAGIAGRTGEPFSSVETALDGKPAWWDRAPVAGGRASVIAEQACRHAFRAGQRERARGAMVERWEEAQDCRAVHLINVAARATHCADGNNSTLIDGEDLVGLVVEILGDDAADDAHADIYDIATEALDAFHFQIVVDQDHADALRAGERYAARIVDVGHALPTIERLAELIVAEDDLVDMEDARDIAQRAIARGQLERDVEATKAADAARCTLGWECRKSLEALYETHEALRESAPALIATPIEPSPAPTVRKHFDLATEPGLLGDLARWSLAYAFRPIAEFAQLSALAVLAPLFARRFATPTGLGLNLYLVGLATTGSGKEALIGAPPAALNAAGLGFLIGPGDFTSDSAIEVALRARPNFLAPIDEVGEFVGAAQHRNAAGFSRTIRKSLLELHSKSRPDGRWTGKQKADATQDKAADPLYSPSLSILGASTGSGFFESLTESNISDGFINRLVVVQGGRAGELNLDHTRTTVPSALAKALTSAYDLSSAGNLAPSTARNALSPPKMRHVPWANDGAEDAWMAIWDWQRLAEDAGRAGFTGRAAANVLVVATLRALARDPEAPGVALGDIDWAWELVQASIDTIERGARENMSGSDFEQLVKAIEAAVIKAGVDGLPRSMLLRARGVSRHTPQMVDAAIKRLVETETVFNDIRGPKGGRPVNRIVATCFQTA
jgi:hypothetical protein